MKHRGRSAPGFFLVWAVLLAASASLATQYVRQRPIGDTTAATPGPDMRLDLNLATAADLLCLPRIGPTLADAIVLDRKQRGPFRSVDDLARVKRIGERTIDQLRPYVVVSPEIAEDGNQVAGVEERRRSSE